MPPGSKVFATLGSSECYVTEFLFMSRAILLEIAAEKQL